MLYLAVDLVLFLREGVQCVGSFNYNVTQGPLWERWLAGMYTETDKVHSQESLVSIAIIMIDSYLWTSQAMIEFYLWTLHTAGV